MVIKTTPQLKEVLDGISFANSCIDMGWQWKIEDIRPPGWLLQCSFQRPERDSGLPGLGWGRKMFIEYGATADSVRKTAYVSASLIVTHELMEAFKIKDVDGSFKRPFDPHNSCKDLVKLQR